MAIKANDPKLIADCFRSLTKEGFSERQIYRLALAVEPELTYEDWAERTQVALLRNPPG
jgi:hypothetical protein